jgi:alcohol dehydrogenase class IV
VTQGGRFEEMNIAGGFPRKIVFGKGSVESLPEVISELGLSGSCMLVTGRSFARNSGYLDRLRNLLERAGVKKIVIFDKVEPNPSVRIVDEGGRIALEQGVDFVVDFGGGSALDTAKGIAVVVAAGGESISNYFHPPEVKQAILPIIAIPTTCGTGSEVTRYAIISEAKKKNAVRGDGLIPIAAILDSETLRYLPRDILAHTAMDALSHAIESCFHIKSSEMTLTFSAEALRTIFENFAQAYDGDLDFREKLFYASMLAGLSINFSGAVIVHALGYYLTEEYGIPHGLANTFFLPGFIEYCLEKTPERIPSLCRRIGITPGDPAECSRILIGKINEMRHYAKMPLSLLEAGIPESEFDKLVEECLYYKRNIEACIVPPDRANVECIIRGAFRRATR